MAQDREGVCGQIKADQGSSFQEPPDHRSASGNHEISVLGIQLFYDYDV